MSHFHPFSQIIFHQYSQKLFLSSHNITSTEMSTISIQYGGLQILIHNKKISDLYPWRNTWFQIWVRTTHCDSGTLKHRGGLPKSQDAFKDQKSHVRGQRNRPMIINEIKSIINSLSKTESTSPRWIHQTFKEEIIPILYNIFHKTEAERILPNTFKGQHYSNTKTRQRHYQESKLDQMSLMNKMQKSLTKYRRILHHDQVGFAPCMQVWFNIWKSINVKKKEEKRQLINVIHQSCQQAKKDKSYDSINKYRKSI